MQNKDRILKLGAEFKTLEVMYLLRLEYIHIGWVCLYFAK